jgi:putative transposase
MSRQRRQFSAEFKTKVVLELLEGSETLNQIAANMTYCPRCFWLEKAVLENAALAFEPAKAVKEYKDELAAKDREIDQLQKALGKRTAELDWLSGKLAGSVSLSDRRQMIETGPQTLSLSVQCRLLRLHRTGLYYQVREKYDATDVLILNRMDEIYTESPFYGHRRIAGELHKQGFVIGRHRVANYMKVLVSRLSIPRRNDQHRSSIPTIISTPICLTSPILRRPIRYGVVISPMWGCREGLPIWLSLWTGIPRKCLHGNSIPS